MIETIWFIYLREVHNLTWMYPEFFTITPIRVTYGLGAAAIVVIVIPLTSKLTTRLKLVYQFLLSALLCAVIELVSSLMLVLVFGYNPLWDYSSEPFNFGGHICLKNGVLFGMISLVYIYIIYPLLEKGFKKMGDARFNQFFWFIFVTYAADLVFMCVKTLFHT